MSWIRASPPSADARRAASPTCSARSTAASACSSAASSPSRKRTSRLSRWWIDARSAAGAPGSSSASLQQGHRERHVLRLGEEHERLGPVGPRRGPRGELGRQRPPALDVARREVRARRRCRAAIEVGAVLRRCQPHRVLAELRGDHRCALRGRRPGCGLEQRSKLGIRPVGREREVTCTGERILGDLCQATVDALPLTGREPLIEDRGQERVREPDRAAGQLDHVRGERRVERARVDPRAGELCRRQARIRGGEHENLTRRGLEAVETGGDELLQPFGDGQRLRRVAHGAVGAERPRELERVERVASRHRVQSQERRPRHAAGVQAART